jgi:hypothetical protein
VAAIQSKDSLLQRNFLASKSEDLHNQRDAQGQGAAHRFYLIFSISLCAFVSAVSVDKQEKPSFVFNNSCGSRYKAYQQ